MKIPARTIAALEKLGRVEPAVPLSRRTTIGVGGPADLILTVANARALGEAVGICTAARLPIFVLGSGSNIVVADAGIRGVVIDNRARHEEQTGEEGVLRVESGASFAGFARKMCREGLGGLAWAVGIPGTLGGAVVYNAGAYGGCLADVLERVAIAEPDGSLDWYPAASLGLVYRGSVFTREALHGRTVLEVELRLWPGDRRGLLAEAAAFDEKRLAAQPRGRSAGSMFKNPPGRPAWKLIDEVGMRGMRRGDAAVSEKHCNFFVNYGQARAADVASLVEEAERRVRDRFGVELQREVAFVGHWQ